jgi:hypothetical protein
MSKETNDPHSGNYYEENIERKAPEKDDITGNQMRMKPI